MGHFFFSFSQKQISPGTVGRPPVQKGGLFFFPLLLNWAVKLETKLISGTLLSAEARESG